MFLSRNIFYKKHQPGMGFWPPISENLAGQSRTKCIWVHV